MSRVALARMFGKERSVNFFIIANLQVYLIIQIEIMSIVRACAGKQDYPRGPRPAAASEAPRILGVFPLDAALT